VKFTSLDAITQARFARTSALDVVVQGEVVKTASLNAYTTLMNSYERSASLDGVVVVPVSMLTGLISYWALDGNSTDEKTLCRLYWHPETGPLLTSQDLYF
jgi:hypothetical protein